MKRSKIEREVTFPADTYNGAVEKALETFGNIFSREEIEEFAQRIAVDNEFIGLKILLTIEKPKSDEPLVEKPSSVSEQVAKEFGQF